MNGVHGIIFSYEKSNGLRELTEPRIHGSVPFGGSYRMVDFILSDMVNAGIRDVGVIMHGKCQSMMDHLRSGKSWDLSRSFGGLTLLPVFAYNSARGNGRFRGKLEALDVVKDYLRHIRQDYVLLADSDVALNIDLKAVLESHIKAGADITVVCAPSTGDGLYLNLDETGRVMEAVEEQRQGLRCLQIFLLRTDLLLSLVESNQCVSIVPAVKYEELYLQGGHQNVVCREYADGAPEAYWGIAYNKRRPLNEHGQRFRAFVRDYFTRINAEYAAATRA